VATGAFRFPSINHRVLTVGRTGSGKTQAGAWLLSEAPFHEQPYIIVDYKFDELLNGCDRIKEITLTERLPKQPGLYIVHPTPEVDDDAVEAFLWDVWRKENIGLFIDEGYMIPQTSKSVRALLTQGRSKSIPVIMLSQRPAWITRFAVSEADFYMVFHLQHHGDKKRIAEFTPPGFAQKETREFHSKWFDVAKNNTFFLKPVPSAHEILSRIDERLTPPKKRLI
jgi:DNA helicase HerA-like ATPase